MNKWGLLFVFPFVMFALYKEWWYTRPYVTQLMKRLEEAEAGEKRWENIALTALGVAEKVAEAAKKDGQS